LRIPGLEIRDVNCAPFANERFGPGLRVMDEGDDRGDISVAQRKRRHSLVYASGADDRSDLVAAHVFGHEL
jgi:hypothetical protein